MRLTTIGTGTAAPHPRRVQSGSLIEAGDARILVDCGSGVLWRMAELGLDWAAVTHVAVTHFHADHTTDLVNLLVAWRYGMLPPRAAPVTLIGPPGFGTFADRVATAFIGEMRDLVPGSAFIDLAPGESVALADGVSLEACKVPHTEESVALAVRAGSRRIVCSGDTGFDRAFAEWAAGADLLMLECSLPAALAIPIHLTPELCGAVAAIAQPRRLLLNHFYPAVEEVDITGLVAASFKGPVTLTNDGQQFAVD